MLRKLLYLFTAILLLASCGEDSKHFKIEGRLLQMNQGEFYVYSNGAGVEGLDTIKVQGGRFSFEMPCLSPVTLTLVFPNFSETPIFAEPGKTAKIDGDASHLKMLKVKGTKDNELMTTFRSQISNASPPEIKHYVGTAYSRSSAISRRHLASAEIFYCHGHARLSRRRASS